MFGKRPANSTRRPDPDELRALTNPRAVGVVLTDAQLANILEQYAERQRGLDAFEAEIVRTLRAAMAMIGARSL